MQRTTFPGRLAIQQRILPAYRAQFFDTLATMCEGGLSVFAGMPLPEENTPAVDRLQVARYALARNRHFFSFTSPFYQCWQSGLVAWLEHWQPDVLILEANSRNLSNRLAARWMHARNRPLLGWGLGNPSLSGLLAPWRWRSRVSFIKSLDGMIAYSRRGAEEYRAFGFPSGRVFVAPNAVSPRPVSPPAPRPESITRRMRVLFVGRLQARKRIDLLLRACASLPGDLQPEVWIIGDGPARTAFEALAEKVYPQAEFTGALHGAALADRFSRADLFILPGTGGLAVQQAMSFGLPVIVADGDGTQDDLVRSENGWRVAPGNLEALAAALGSALSDVGRLRAMGAASFRIVLEEANLESMASVFVQAANALYNPQIMSYNRTG